MNLYILQCDVFFKVGIAKDVNARVSSMQSGNPKKITIKRVYSTKLARKAERKAHEKLSNYKVSGEWFKCDLELVEESVLSAIKEAELDAKEAVCISESFVIETMKGESISEAMKRRSRESLNLAVEYFGSQKNLAAALGTSKQTVNNWIKRGRISASSAIDVEEVTKGDIKKQDLRPDVVEWIGE